MGHADYALFFVPTVCEKKIFMTVKQRVPLNLYFMPKRMMEVSTHKI